MNPKDKARELVLKFYPEVRWKLGQEDCIKRAKNCALIAVDEIIIAMKKVEVINPFNVYWVSVKKEIEKL
jgi:hypothetical protein